MKFLVLCELWRRRQVIYSCCNLHLPAVCDEKLRIVEACTPGGCVPGTDARTKAKLTSAISVNIGSNICSAKYRLYNSAKLNN